MQNTLPAFRLFANGKNLADTLANSLSSLTVTDETGYESDTLELEITDPEGRFELPRLDSWLNLHLGYKDGVMRDFGYYAVSEVSAKGPPDIITVRAKSTPMAGARKAAEKPAGDTPDKGAPVKQSLHEMRRISYEPGTFAKLLAEVCIRSDLIFRAPIEIWHLELPHIDQTDESDLALVSRLARERGCVVKVTGSVLAVTKRSAGQTVSGTPLTPRRLRPSDVSDWACVFGGIKPYRSAVCHYYDKKAGVSVEVREGKEPPVYFHPYDLTDAASARQCARAILQRTQEGNSTLTLRMPMETEIIAEQPVDLEGFRDGVSGRWLIDRVEHRFDKTGAVTSLQGRQTA